MPGCLRHRSLRIALVALLALSGGCRGHAQAGWSPTRVARQYFEYLRDRKVSSARDLCYFEDDRAEQLWVAQMAAYLERRRSGEPAWWGQTFKEQVVREKRSRRPVAFIEVQWLYQVRDGWMMGPHYTYRMRRVGDEWRMLITTYDPKRGVPFVPKLSAPSDD